MSAPRAKRQLDGITHGHAQSMRRSRWASALLLGIVGAAAAAFIVATTRGPVSAVSFSFSESSVRASSTPQVNPSHTANPASSEPSFSEPPIVDPSVVDVGYADAFGSAVRASLQGGPQSDLVVMSEGDDSGPTPPGATGGQVLLGDGQGSATVTLVSFSSDSLEAIVERLLESSCASLSSAYVAGCGQAVSIGGHPGYVVQPGSEYFHVFFSVRSPYIVNAIIASPSGQGRGTPVLSVEEAVAWADEMATLFRQGEGGPAAQ